MNAQPFGETLSLADLSPEITPEGNDLFEPDAPVNENSAIIARPGKLCDDIAALEHRLAVSLGVPATSEGYDPDLFVVAVKAVHDRLENVRDHLQARAQELDKRAIALECAEKAVQRRSKQLAGLAALAPLIGTTRQRRPFWRVFWR